MRVWGLAVAAIKVPKGVVMFERKGKPQKGVNWDVYVFLVCGHEPPCMPCEVRGQPTPSLSPFWDDGGPEDDFWPEAPPTQIFDVMAKSDPLWETPQSQGKFGLAKLGLVLPPIDDVHPHLSSKEIKRIARAVYTANIPHGQGVGIKPIFVSSDPEEDPRVEGLREGLHKDYDGR